MKVTSAEQKIKTRLKTSSLVEILRDYHQYQTIGLENIPKTGRALLVVNHSFATYELMLLFHAITAQRNRIARPLADRLFFRIPYLKWIPEAFGGIEGRPQEAEELLKHEELLVVAPGGMHEMVRPSTERYQLKWDNRQGFIRLAITTGTPIILAVCPRADDLYQVYRTTITDLAYRHLRIPLVLARGLGPTFLARPIKLTHMVRTPILPPSPSLTKKGLDTQVRQLHRYVYQEAKALMNRAVAET